VLAAEVIFTDPPYRAVQVLPANPGHYLLTFYDRGRPLPGLERLPFRRTQWTAITNGHRQPIYLKPSGQIFIEMADANLHLKMETLQMPAFLKGPELGTVKVDDFEAAMVLADRMTAESV
jgi:hypothetical protein